MTSSPPLWVLVEMRRMLRRDRMIAMVLAGFTAFAGAVCLYAAIDDWLRGNAFWSAVNTAVAFFNSITFSHNMDFLSALRIIDGRLRAHISEKEATHEPET